MRNPFRRHPDYPFQSWQVIVLEMALGLAVGYGTILLLCYVLAGRWAWTGIAISVVGGTLGTTCGVLWGIRRDRRRATWTSPAGEDLRSPNSLSRWPW